jgi:hypothetical protein
MGKKLLDWLIFNTSKTKKPRAEAQGLVVICVCSSIGEPFDFPGLRNKKTPAEARVLGVCLLFIRRSV